MNEHEQIAEIAERPDSFWRRVYAAVIVVTFIVITLLWTFSKFFSS
jgi:hypothetical protein